MAFGVPYKGSKNAIARWLVDQLPSGERFVDLFAGGCAVTHAAMLSGKYKFCLANDIGNAHLLFYDAVNGRLQNVNRWIDREMFMAERDSNPIAQWCYSFGNDGHSYMYARDIEPYKKLVHHALTDECVIDRYHAFRHAIVELAHLLDMGGA